MATKTQLLRAALERQGFKPAETKSQRDCVVGNHASGATVYLFLDQTGGARWPTEPLIGTAKPLSSRSIQLLLSGWESKFFGPVRKEPAS